MLYSRIYRATQSWRRSLRIAARYPIPSHNLELPPYASCWVAYIALLSAACAQSFVAFINLSRSIIYSMPPARLSPQHTKYPLSRQLAKLPGFWKTRSNIVSPGLCGTFVCILLIETKTVDAVQTMSSDASLHRWHSMLGAPS